jgi:DNA polymerase elongation subunit (family B)
MIISTFCDNKNIYVSWRENGEKKEEIKPFRPYFFIDDEDREFRFYNPSKYTKREFEYETGEWYSLEGRKLKKVYVENATDIRDAKEKFSKTWEADVRYHHRYAIDNLTEIPEYKMRKWYWDMEWQQGGEHHDKITTIVMYDNYDKEYIQWAWFPNWPSGFSARQPSNRLIFDTEKDMLENFLETMQKKNPDMLIAWFGLKFDLPKLIDRCCALGVSPLKLSPYASVSNVFPTKDGYRFTKAEEGFSPISQPIGGRICLNLDLAFERQWNDSQRGTLPSLSLNYVSEYVLGRNKLESEKFPDPNEFYRRAWLEDTETYLNYAVIDVELMVEIDDSNYCSEAMLALQRLLVAPFDACFYASHMGGVYFMRNASWKAPTGFRPKNKICPDCNTINDKKAKVCKSCKVSLSYQGAMVYDPLSESTNGLHKGVAAFDFAGLYPSMILARNISFETISDTPTELGANLATPKDFSICDKKDMVYFKTDKLGLLPTAVLELKELRNEYKARMKEAKRQGNNSEYVKWHNNQMAVKRLSASFYGILAFAGFGWSNVTLAESITASAREAIRLAAFKAKEMEV